MSTSFGEPLDFLSAALKLSTVKRTAWTSVVCCRTQVIKQDCWSVALLEETSEPLNCDASYAQKLGPLDEVSQGHSVFEEKPNCTKYLYKVSRFISQQVKI